LHRRRRTPSTHLCVSSQTVRCIPRLISIKLQNVDHGTKGYALAELTTVYPLYPCLFPATQAEKLCVAAYHPEIFSEPKYLELVYGITGAESGGRLFPTFPQESLTVKEERALANGKRRGCSHENSQVSRAMVAENNHPLGQPQMVGTKVVQVPACRPPRAPIVINHERKKVTPNDILHLHHSEKKPDRQIKSMPEIFEMGNPRSPLQQALFEAQKAGYAGHRRVETGIEAQPHSMQFTKLTAHSYEKINLTLEWFRNCCEYARSIGELDSALNRKVLIQISELCFPSAAEGWLWETAIQQQCNEVYYFYIHEHCSYGTLLPPRLDLRPVQTCSRAIRFEQYYVPQHEWKLEHQEKPDDLDLVLIRGPYESPPTSLRKQAGLGWYAHVGDPHQHVLFQVPQESGDLERWRTRNLTEDGTLFRYSRRNTAPSLVQYDDIDHVALFHGNRCRRYFPRLHSNVYSNSR
jgi:hypothetical protein